MVDDVSSLRFFLIDLVDNLMESELDCVDNLLISLLLLALTRLTVISGLLDSFEFKTDDEDASRDSVPVVDN